MELKLEDALFKEFPTLYNDNLVWGFECRDGWFDLIWELSEALANTDNYWELAAIQVKEKFGGLRFYINGGTEEQYDIIIEAEKLSETICERCGDPSLDGPMASNGWISTLCKDCSGG